MNVVSLLSLMLRLHYAIFRAILRECENAMPLVMPENVDLVQTDVLSHTAGIALSYEMSRNIALIIAKKSEFCTFLRQRNLAKLQKKRIVEPELHSYYRKTLLIITTIFRAFSLQRLNRSS